jgi:hypothetical protein
MVGRLLAPRGSVEPKVNLLCRRFCIAGATIFLAFLGSLQLFKYAPFDTPMRGAGQGALSASGSLVILWVICAAVLSVIYRRETTISFRVVLVLNVILATILIRDFFS